MQAERQDVLWLDRTETVSISQLASLSGLTEAEVRDLVECGILAPADPRGATSSFSADCVVTVRKASRLRDDLQLDSHSLALALALLQQIRALEAELRQLRAQQASFRHF